MKVLVYSLIFWLIVSDLYSQRSVMRHFDTKNGLPSNEVYQVLSDSKGYIWICTDAGLVKYNGNTFKQFNSGNGLPDNTIFQVKEDKYGRIWYVSYTGKIGYVSNDSIYVIDPDNKMEEFVTNGLITSIAFDEHNNLYVGRRNLEKNSFLKIAPPYSSNNISKVWDAENFEKGITIRILSENEFVFSDSRYNSSTKEFPLTIFVKNELVFSSKELVTTRTLFTRAFKDKNSLYLIFGNELLKFDLATHRLKKVYSENSFVTVASIDPGVIMVGKSRSGIEYIDEDLVTKNIENELGENTLTYAIKDYQGGSWLSTLESGVYYYPKRSVSSLKLSEAGEMIYKVSKLSDSSLIVAVNPGKIFQYDLSTTNKLNLKKEYRFSELKEFYPFFIGEDNKIININGDKGSYDLDLISGNITKRKELKMLGTNLIKTNSCMMYQGISGVTIIDTMGISKFIKSEDRLTSIAYEKKTGTILLGGLRGLYHFKGQESISSKSKILTCRTEDVGFDTKQNAFAATRAYGLIVISNGKNDTISEKDGLISNICRSLTIDSEFVWVCTNKGVSRIKYMGPKQYDIHNYSLSSFVEPTSINKIHVLKNLIVFTSGNTLYWFNKKDEASDSRMRIVWIKVNGENVSFNKPLLLEDYQSDITISFEALLFDCGIDLNYRYKLSANDPWIYTRETTITFQKLTSGNYNLEIEVLNKQGNWVSLSKPISISIDRPIYQKTWFIIAIILGLSGFVFLILRRRYKRILNEERIKSELKINMYELETKVVKAQMNPHFIFNSLNSIQQFILANENENAYKYLTKFSKLVRKLLESTTTEDITVEDEIDLLNRYIEIEALRFEDSFNYEMHIDPELKVSSTRIPHMIIQPFVENAIWHGLLHKKGKRILKISFLYLNKKCLTCSVEDNGVGRFGKSTQVGDKSSLAMDFIKKRLDIINELRASGCGFEIIDKQESTHSETGTIVIVRIPIMNT